MRSTFSLSLYACVGLLDNERPTKSSTIPSFWCMPLLRTHPSQTSIASISDRPPSANHISRTHPLEPVRSTFSLPLYACVGLLDNETPTKPSATLSAWYYAPPSHISVAPLWCVHTRIFTYPCGKYISLPLYACVGLWSNETPTVKCVLMTCAPPSHTSVAIAIYNAFFFIHCYCVRRRFEPRTRTLFQPHTSYVVEMYHH